MTGQYLLVFGVVWVVSGISLLLLLLFIPTPDLKGAATAIGFLTTTGAIALALFFRQKREQ